MDRIDHGSIIFPGQVDDTQRTWIIISFVFSSIGIVLSIIAFVLLVLTAVLFKEWRQNYKNQLLLQFMLARILHTSVRYVYDVKHIFELCETDCVIILDTLGMTYTEVVLISWMFVFSKQMYEDLVNVFNVQKTNLLRTSLCTWLVPGVIAIIAHFSFFIQHDKDILFYLIYLGLIKWPILIANAVVLIKILKSILKNNKNTENNFRITVVMVILIFMFSFQQFLLDVYILVYVILLNNYIHYLLRVGSIITLYHCAFSIIFWVFGNANTRKLWLNNNKIRPQSRL